MRSKVATRNKATRLGHRVALNCFFFLGKRLVKYYVLSFWKYYSFLEGKYDLFMQNLWLEIQTIFLFSILKGEVKRICSYLWV